MRLRTRIAAFPLMALVAISMMAGAGSVLWAQAPEAALQPPDTLDGPPFVTARAWAIGDGKTGEILWGHEADTPRKAASTTKMMCAYVVAQLADKDPGVLKEMVTFSKLADSTTGSTAGIRAGESISVAECLYGLLLPSGNDAGNALAEHFNDRLPPLSSEEPEPPAELRTRARFIAEMNRTARALGLKHTTYRSPFGDGGIPTDTTTSPSDLVRLGVAVLRHPLLKPYVATRHYATHVVTPDGGRREVAWTNTNQLLGITGYDGIKTGTTPLAGACLVASGHRGDDHLIVVVLGSVHTEARYTDSRNLFRWAWQQRQKP